MMKQSAEIRISEKITEISCCTANMAEQVFCRAPESFCETRRRSGQVFYHLITKTSQKGSGKREIQ